jgi:hypothetical protein
MRVLIEENVTVLLPGAELVAGLSEGAYSRPGPFDPRSGAGAHVRHVIEFTDAFLRGAATGRIDYAERARDLRLETDAVFAAERMRELAVELSTLDSDRDAPLLVRSEGDAASDVWSASTVGRELQVLASHTVHHYALVALVLRLDGVDVPEEFGVAPSTLRYWRSGVCAR